MAQQIEAVYENGVFRPLEALALRESSRVQLSISQSAAERPLRDLTDYKLLEYAGARSASLARVPTVEEVRGILSKIPGSMAEVIIAERGEY